jgi:hypothetical protein
MEAGMNQFESSHANLAHVYFACREKYNELVFNANIFKLTSLAILPGILLIAAQTSNPDAIRVGLAFVSIGSIPTWIWEINSAIRGLDRQRETCSLVIRDGRRLLDKLTDALKNNSNQLESLSERANELHDQVISDSVSVSAAINILAKQSVMNKYGYHCTTCNSPRRVGAVMSKRQIRRFLKEANAGRRCQECLQELE